MLARAASVWERKIFAMISFAMHLVLFMDPSMNRADSVSLMQIAPAHSSLGLPSVPDYLPPQQRKIGERDKKGEKNVVLRQRQ